MTETATLSTLALDVLAGVVQGVLLGTVLAAGAWLLLKKALSVNATTRFATWFALLIVLAVVTIVCARPDRSNETAVAEPVFAQAGTTRTAAGHPPKLEEHAGQLPAAEPPPAPLISLPVSRDLPEAAVSLYAVVIGFLSLRLVFSYVRLRRMKRNGRTAPPELRERFEQWRRMSRSSRRVSLLVSSDGRGPLLAGFLTPAVILPESLLLQMTGEELDDAGLHELAHLRRYDDWTTLVQRLFRMLFFFHPAVHWVCRELDFEREVACDDSVLAVTNAAKPYARSLAKMVEVAPRRAPLLASGAAFRKPQIVRRIELLLNAARDRRPGISGLSFVLVMLVVIGIASEFANLPAFVAMVEGGNYHHSRWKVDGRTVTLEMAGDIEFAEDDVSVAQMSPHALVRVEERTAWSGRKVEIRNGASGRPELRYFLRGQERPLDEPGRAWLASILPKLIRDTGINAEERAERILFRKGPAALMQEIERISNDGSRRRYLLTAIESRRLDVEDMRRTLRIASRMSSDHDKATLLIETSDSTLTPEFQSYFFDVVNTISSDHDRRRVIHKAVAECGEDMEVMALAGRAVEKMSSDHDKAEVLRQMPFDLILRDDTVRKSVLRAAGSIQSDHDKSRMLARIFEMQAVDSRVLPEIMSVTEKIQSDSEKSSLLERVRGDSLSESAAREAFFRTVRTVHSSNDRARLLTGFLKRNEINPDLLQDICRSAEGIASDHDKANVLSVARAPLPTACFDAIRSISSDGDKRRVLERVLTSNAPPENARSAVETARTISSDRDKAEVLICAAQRYADEATRDAIRKVAEGVSSDSDYRRVTSKLLDPIP